MTDAEKHEARLKTLQPDLCLDLAQYFFAFRETRFLHPSKKIALFGRDFEQKRWFETEML